MENYDDGPSQSAPADKGGKVDQGGETAVIPKSLLSGKECQVGEEVTLKITGIHGDEVEVQCADHGDTEPDSDSDEPAPAAEPQADAAPVTAPPSGGGMYE